MYEKQILLATLLVLLLTISITTVDSLCCLLWGLGAAIGGSLCRCLGAVDVGALPVVGMGLGAIANNRVGRMGGAGAEKWAPKWGLRV